MDKLPGSEPIGTENDVFASLPNVLARRLSKAQLFLDAAGELDGYQHQFPEESLTNCLAILKQIHEYNRQCHQLRMDLGQMAQLRQANYEGDAASLKGMANALCNHIFRHYKQKTLFYELTRVISLRIRAQHPLPLPEDVLNTNATRMETYKSSYKVLSELFMILVGTLKVIRFEPTECQLDYPHLWKRLEEVQTVDAQTEALVAQLMATHQLRLNFYDELIRRTRAIFDRVRQQYGSDHVLFRRMIRNKI